MVMFQIADCKSLKEDSEKKPLSRCGNVITINFKSYEQSIHAMRTHYFAHKVGGVNVNECTPLTPIPVRKKLRWSLLMTDEHIDSHGNLHPDLAAFAENGCPVIHLYSYKLNPAENGSTFFIQHNIKLPRNLKEFHIKSNYPFTSTGKPVDVFVLYEGTEINHRIGARNGGPANFDELCDYFVANCLPKLDIPVGCKVYFGDRAVN